MGRNGQALIAPSDQSLLGDAQEECVLQSKFEANPGRATSGGGEAFSLPWLPLY